MDDLIIKSVNQQIDFNDEDYMYEMENALENDLKKIFHEGILDIEEMEAILLFTQARKQYLVKWFLKQKSFCDVVELEKVFPIILDSYMRDEKIPKETIEYYLDLCNSTPINDYDKEINCFECERWEELHRQWYNEEIKQMPLQQQEIASLDYVVFESLYDFTGYWANEPKEKTQDHIQWNCIRQIQASIFSILWVYEENKEFYFPEHKHTDVPRILKEIERIKEDVMFLKKNFNKKRIRDKIELYINLNILVL